MPDGFPVTFQAATISPDSGLIAVGAELVTVYADRVRKQLKLRFVFCIGYANDTFGYAPTGRMLGQGCYEED